ncbi:MAG: hypothetical protein ACRESZ_21995, partial [Methylococcales bacterium]
MGIIGPSVRIHKEGRDIEIDVLADKSLHDLPYKIEIDEKGLIEMSPASFYEINDFVICLGYKGYVISEGHFVIAVPEPGIFSSHAHNPLPGT